MLLVQDLAPLALAAVVRVVPEVTVQQVELQLEHLHGPVLVVVVLLVEASVVSRLALVLVVLEAPQTAVLVV